MMRNCEFINTLNAFALFFHQKLSSIPRDSNLRSEASRLALLYIGECPGISIRALSEKIDRSHSGTVRLIDGLASHDLVERRRVKDRRMTALYLLDSGNQSRRNLISEGWRVIEEMLVPLTNAQRQQLATLLREIMQGLPSSDLNG
ncbi:MAG: winged helix-turn-helix transcriptional regulator [Sphingomonadaceae bacterium]|nr:winged helix-turn-helix transcriptional regulator [Sphingomonadaceae bacterium]